MRIVYAKMKCVLGVYYNNPPQGRLYNIYIYIYKPFIYKGLCSARGECIRGCKGSAKGSQMSADVVQGIFLTDFLHSERACLHYVCTMRFSFNKHSVYNGL